MRELICSLLPSYSDENLGSNKKQQQCKMNLNDQYVFYLITI